MLFFGKIRDCVLQYVHKLLCFSLQCTHSNCPFRGQASRSSGNGGNSRYFLFPVCFFPYMDPLRENSFLCPIREYLAFGSIWKTNILSTVRKMTLYLFVGVFKDLDTILMANVSRLEGTDKKTVG